MQFDYDTFNKVMTAAVPAVIIAFGAFFTARNITTKIERMKLDAQADLEKQRLEYQAALERERMEFQGDSEAQKQRMELYKTLFSVKLETVTRLSKLIYEAYGIMVDHVQKFDAPTINSTLRPILEEAANLSNANRWLFADEVTDSSADFLRVAFGFLETTDISSRSACISDMMRTSHKLSQKINEMMSSSSLENILKAADNNSPPVI